MPLANQGRAWRRNQGARNAEGENCRFRRRQI